MTIGLTTLTSTPAWKSPLPLGDPGGCISAAWPEGMASSDEVRASRRGHGSLPDSAWPRWGIEGAGQLGRRDPRDTDFLVPEGFDGIRRMALAAVTSDDWAAAGAGFGDGDRVSE
jgi:hypothetical protein